MPVVLVPVISERCFSLFAFCSSAAVVVMAQSDKFQAGPPRAGAPLPGLRAEELEQFVASTAAFVESDSVKGATMRFSSMRATTRKRIKSSSAFNNLSDRQ
jgi:hypothetical protein